METIDLATWEFRYDLDDDARTVYLDVNSTHRAAIRYEQVDAFLEALYSDDLSMTLTGWLIREDDPYCWRPNITVIGAEHLFVLRFADASEKKMFEIDANRSALEFFVY